MTTCQAGHTFHETKQAHGFHIFDWERYRGFAGYCPGQDDVSMSIDLYGEWEPTETKQCMEVLRKGDIFIDFGSHIGWYSVQALRKGAIVYAFDQDPENMRVFWMNALGNVESHTAPLSEVPEWSHRDQVRLVKSDVEGAEDEAIRIIRPLLKSNLVDFLMLECSPEFADYYPSLIDELRGYGFGASVDGVEITGETLGDVQRNVFFSR